jgi:DNA sulfur modification protein DndE
MVNLDSEGQPLHGMNNYVIHFAPQNIPPVNAFWSLTLYNKDHYLVRNELKRYALGDRDPLTYNPDGSLDIYIQHLNPGKEYESNWLPAPTGFFNLMLRMYWPKDEVLKGKWGPPAVVKRS